MATPARLESPGSDLIGTLLGGVDHVFFERCEQGVEAFVAVGVENPGVAPPVFTSLQTVLIVALAERPLRAIILGKLGAGEAED